MALITCDECGKQISSRADACPHCGAPNEQAASGTKKVKVTTRRKGGVFEGVGFLVILAGIVMMIAGNLAGPVIAVGGLVVFLIGRFM